MIERFKRSFKAKLIISFLIAAGIPYLLTFLFLLGGSEQKILKNISKELSHQTRIVSSDIKKSLASTIQEVGFLAKYEIMDDALTADIDKRITKLLEAKKSDMGIDGDLICTDMQGKVIASSRTGLIGKTAPKEYLQDGFYDLHSSVLTAKEVFSVSRPIKASFDGSLIIGHMVLEYAPENFNSYLFSDADKKVFLVQPKTSQVVGNSAGLRLSLAKSSGIEDIDGYIVGYQRLDDSPLSQWYIVSATAKKEAMQFLTEFRLSFFASVAVGVLLIIIVSVFFAGKVIRPIRELFEAATQIVQTGDYSKRVHVASQDEIGRLSESFNAMTSRVERSMASLERENEERLRLFVTLVGIFHKILAATSRENTLQVCKQQLQSFLPNDDIELCDSCFGGEKPDDIETFAIEEWDFDQNEAVKTSFITVGRKGGLSQQEMEFFASIAKMIALQLERLKLLEKTEAASRAKSAFIANMSHELRTPLNGIIGFSQFLQSANVLPAQYEQIPKNIEIAGQHLLSMINEILDLAKIEAGKMEVDIQSVELDITLLSVAAITSSLAAQKGIEFEYPTQTGIKVTADEKALKQILINLVSNAVKFTESGFVRITTDIDENSCTITVEDSGIGISADDQKALFSDFVQIENPLQKKHKGTGLGLSLSRKLVHLMGGELHLSSDGPNKGTTAVITLKAA